MTNPTNHTELCVREHILCTCPYKLYSEIMFSGLLRHLYIAVKSTLPNQDTIHSADGMFEQSGSIFTSTPYHW